MEFGTQTSQGCGLLIEKAARHFPTFHDIAELLERTNEIETKGWHGSGLIRWPIQPGRDGFGVAGNSNVPT